MSDQTRQPPVKEFSSGGISAAIWKNEVTDSEGVIRVQHSVRIQKRFKDLKTGQWTDSQYYFPNDLPRLSLVAQKAFEFIAIHDRDPQAAAAFLDGDVDAPAEEG